MVGGAALTLGATHYVRSAPSAWAMPVVGGQTGGIQGNPWFQRSQPHPHTLEFVALLRQSGEHGLDPSDYALGEIERALAGTDGADTGAASQLLSKALISYARDLRIARDQPQVTYIDPELAPSAPEADTLRVDNLLASRLQSLHETNPVYEELRTGLAQYRRTWSGLPRTQIPDGPSLDPGTRGPRVALLRQRLGLQDASAKEDRFDAALGEAVQTFRVEHGLVAGPVVDRVTIEALNLGAAHFESIIVANLNRVRGLPLNGSRYILVDTAGAKLRLIEGGVAVDTMHVIVGKPGMETPMLAGFIRYAMVNPYWNVPPDLVRNSIAPAVLREGHGALTRRNFVLSPDWQTTKKVDPATVDWSAIVDGRESIWVRQLPGGGNMMGDVKFMLPNEMGIYLHDTPDKSLFQRADRRLSSGCVRVEGADRLARWLFGRQILEGDSEPDRRIDLPEPVPVFVTYLTVSHENGRIRFRPDVEQRDTKVQLSQIRINSDQNKMLVDAPDLHG